MIYSHLTLHELSCSHGVATLNENMQCPAQPPPSRPSGCIMSEKALLVKQMLAGIFAGTSVR